MSINGEGFTMYVPRHKVFISYYHEDDQFYKNQLIRMKEYNVETQKYQSIFDDYSVHENEIDDHGLTSEQIRRIIRDEYIKDATVLILLCGDNTRKRKHIDWEIHAAMYDSDTNPKMGILVINLPSISSKQGMIATCTDEQEIMSPYAIWSPLDKSKEKLREKYPYLPDRLITNIARDNVRIPVVDWSVIQSNNEKLKNLINNVFDYRTANDYDHSEPLRKNNS